MGKKPVPNYLDILVDETMKTKDVAGVYVALHKCDITSKGRDLAKNIKCPVMIYHGAKDAVIPVKHAQETAAFFGDSCCITVIDPEGGHCPPLDTQEELAGAIVKFVKRGWSNLYKLMYLRYSHVIKELNWLNE